MGKLIGLIPPQLGIRGFRSSVNRSEPVFLLISPPETALAFLPKQSVEPLLFGEQKPNISFDSTPGKKEAPAWEVFPSHFSRSTLPTDGSRFLP